MRSRQYMNRIGRFFDVMGSAIAVSNAVRSGRAARNTDLVRLGIDPEQFRGIKFR